MVRSDDLDKKDGGDVVVTDVVDEEKPNVVIGDDSAIDVETSEGNGGLNRQAKTDGGDAWGKLISQSSQVCLYCYFLEL